MKVFHSSTLKVEHPDMRYSRDFLDFGRGFYLTTMRQQAITYANRFRLRGKSAVLNEYLLDEAIHKNCKIKSFLHYDEEWLDFVMACRKGDDVSDWDIVIGGVANDRVFRTIDLYFSGDMSKADALKRLVKEEPNNQICIRRQELIDRYLHFLVSEELL
ncbi:MAG: DUF3990 domain-containing protein [Paludibacteraceae bacterium]|nr:DUF3990 domain-containing protein [Paludibacteraceae bacterium]